MRRGMCDPFRVGVFGASVIRWRRPPAADAATGYFRAGFQPATLCPWRITRRRTMVAALRARSASTAIPHAEGMPADCPSLPTRTLRSADLSSSFLKSQLSNPPPSLRPVPRARATYEPQAQARGLRPTQTRAREEAVLRHWRAPSARARVPHRFWRVRCIEGYPTRPRGLR